jgi:hypothetical protein
MGYGYGSSRIFSREVVGCMALIVCARSTEIQHMYALYSLFLHLFGLSVEAYLVFRDTWLRFFCCDVLVELLV